MPGRVQRVPRAAQVEAIHCNTHSVRRTRARAVDTLPLWLTHYLRTLLRECPLAHSAPVVSCHSSHSRSPFPMSGVFPLWSSPPVVISVTLRPWDKGCSLTTLLVSRNFCQMAGAQLLSNDQLSATGHTTGGRSKPGMLTLGLRWILNKGSAQTLLAPGALGAAEAGPGRFLARWGMGKGMAMSWARGKLLNAHWSPVGLTQSHTPLNTAMAPWPKRDRVGSKWCLF